MWWLLAACTPVEYESLRVEDFAGPEGRQAELVPEGDPEAAPLLLRIEGGWTLRRGSRWSTAEPVAEWEVLLADGLVVGGEQLLPPSLLAGESMDGVEVVAVEPFETWYGVFPDAVIVERSEGRLAGQHAFGRGVGPILLTVDGQPWELATYE